jgi:Protein of unknown function (DUF1552)
MAPKVFGVFYWANGVVLDQWVPSTTGANWALTPALQPLSALRNDLSVLSGLEVKDSRLGHHSATVGVLSGTPLINQSTRPGGEYERSTFAQPSIDMVVARHWLGQTRLRSLELAVLPNRYDEGTTYEQLSHNGPNDVNPAELSLVTAWTRLFGGPMIDNREQLARKSLLDNVLEDANRLRAKVGPKDRLRLDGHLESVRAIERQLSPGPGGCVGPPLPAELASSGATIERRLKVFADLIAVAVSCDLTRVFSIRLTPPADNTVLGLPGITSGVHDLTHNEGGNQPQLQACVVFAMKQLAVFLARLKAVAEPTGTLLERSVVLCTTDCQLGRSHDNTDFPILLAGSARGKLRPGQHVRSTNGETTSTVLLTLLQALDLPYTQFGTAEMATSRTVPGLLL